MLLLVGLCHVCVSRAQREIKIPACAGEMESSVFSLCVFSNLVLDGVWRVGSVMVAVLLLWTWTDRESESRSVEGGGCRRTDHRI